VDDIRHHFSVSDTITPQFVGNDNPGLAATRFEQALEKSFEMLARGALRASVAAARLG